MKMNIKKRHAHALQKSGGHKHTHPVVRNAGSLHSRIRSFGSGGLRFLVPREDGIQIFVEYFVDLPCFAFLVADLFILALAFLRDRFLILAAYRIRMLRVFFCHLFFLVCRQALSTAVLRLEVFTKVAKAGAKVLANHLRNLFSGLDVNRGPEGARGG
eukprot:g278.t1